MEEKKLDFRSIVGFVLIFGILMWIMYQNAPTEEQIAADKAKKEKLEQAKKNQAAAAKQLEVAQITPAVGDSAALAKLRGTLGAFAYSATLPSAKQDFTTIENDFVVLKIANRGGYIAEAKLKDFERLQKGSGELVELVKNNNADFNIRLQTNDNRVLDTKNMYFEPTLTTSGTDKVLTMRLKAGPEQYLEYRYLLKKDDYMLDFDVRSQGLKNVLNTAKPADMEWDLKTYRNEKSISYENRFTELIYEYEDGKDDYLGHGKDKNTAADKVSYIAYKQHFFTSILLTKKPFEKAEMRSNELMDDSTKDTIFMKQFQSKVPLAYTNGELDYKMNWYYGPADYKLLNAYDRNLDEIIPLGWGIFGWINKFIFVPLFGFLSSFIAYGIAIILFTILIKIAMSPITYKSFLSQAKMKVLRPELAELNEKFAKDPMKKQQETMKLYNKAGVNPMAGCIPALIQLPFMYASFQFFPAAIELRQKSFLWADDLSSFDAIFTWKTHIPVISSFYGNHISLFPILAAIAIFFYMKMTTGDQAMSQPPQEGMPDMGKIMKIMIYISPLMMLFFFNNYGSGLSLYNFISNLVTIAIMIVIKKYVVDEQKIHAQIQENKQKPQKVSKFQKKMQEMMEQAEAQKAIDKKKK